MSLKMGMVLTPIRVAGEVQWKMRSRLRGARYSEGQRNTKEVCAGHDRVGMQLNAMAGTWRALTGSKQRRLHRSEAPGAGMQYRRGFLGKLYR